VGAAESLQRRGDGREVGRVAQAGAGGIGGQAELGARGVDATRSPTDGQLLHRCEAQRHPGERDAVPLGHEGARVLPALAHDDVGPPVLDDRAQAGQRGGGVEAAEEVSDHARVRGVEAELRELAHQRHPVLARRLRHGRERQPGALDVALVPALRGDEHLVTGAQAGTAERGERPDVT
jgi:hypothetical protein